MPVGAETEPFKTSVMKLIFNGYYFFQKMNIFLGDEDCCSFR